ncbi:MAG: CAP domain-containing protein [Clostridiales bacterium]|nr:CAP domain-containing protein [Clostridiales bacterium]
MESVAHFLVQRFFSAPDGAKSPYEVRISSYKTGGRIIMKTSTFRRVLMALVLALATLLASSGMSEPVLAASKKVVCVQKSKKQAARSKKAKAAKITKKSKKAKSTIKKSSKKTSAKKQIAKARSAIKPAAKKQTAKVRSAIKPAAKKQTAKVRGAIKPAAKAKSYVNQNVAGLYGNGRDFKFSINGRQITGHYDAQMSMQLVRLINKYRTSHRRAALATTRTLTKAAMTRSKEITVVFNHVRPNGTSCFTVSSAVSGENIAAGYTDAQRFMNGWKNSPSHNANMLNGSFKAIGISVFAVKTAYGYTYFAVQNFGR